MGRHKIFPPEEETNHTCAQIESNDLRNEVQCAIKYLGDVSEDPTVGK